MEISVNEKRSWVSDLIFRELKRFEEDTQAAVERIRISRVGNRLTSVDLDIRKGNCHESG